MFIDFIQLYKNEYFIKTIFNTNILFFYQLAKKKIICHLFIQIQPTTLSAVGCICTFIKCL